MRFGELPFSVALLVVAGLAAAGVVVAVRLDLSGLWFVGLVPAAAFALAYLAGYHRRPTVDRAPEPEEAFDDPVEAADRIARGEEPPAADATGPPAADATEPPAADATEPPAAGPPDASEPSGPVG